MADWRAITAAADPWLDGLTSEALAQVRDFDVDGQTIRQMLGHTRLPEFVGNIDDEAPYRPEADRTVAAAG